MLRITIKVIDMNIMHTVQLLFNFTNARYLPQSLISIKVSPKILSPRSPVGEIYKSNRSKRKSKRWRGPGNKTLKNWSGLKNKFLGIQLRAHLSVSFNQFRISKLQDRNFQLPSIPSKIKKIGYCLVRKKNTPCPLIMTIRIKGQLGLFM